MPIPLTVLVREAIEQFLSEPGPLVGNTEACNTAVSLLRDAAQAMDHVAPIPMRLNCPTCGALHIDTGEWATRVHKSHVCQYCGLVWRPAVVATVGVRFLPGFKNEEKEKSE